MQYTIQAPETIRADVQLPASKSISNRALIIHALSGMPAGTSLQLSEEASTQLPQNLSDCDDTVVMIRALRDMPDVIDIGAAGTAMRFMTAFLAANTHHPSPITLTGTERMKQRPIAILVNALRQLGADIVYEGEEGFPPLRIVGKPLDGGVIEIPGDMSSQYVSALLMIAPVLRNGLELRLKGHVISRPYIDLTLWMMREFGADADWTSGDTVVVRPQPYQQRPYVIENDWSSASYWYEVMALTADKDAEVRLTGLSDSTKQGDAAVRYIFSMLGVKTLFEEVGGEKVVVLRKSGRVAPRLDYDFVNSPDLAQTLVATCVGMGIPFHFRGLQSLRIKETNRIDALCNEFWKLGIDIRVENGSDLVWDGGQCEPTQEPIDTYEDHRMALSFAPLSLVLPEITISQPQVVTKSYPQFWNELQRAGFVLKTTS